jgi:hypothetical protein
LTGYRFPDEHFYVYRKSDIRAIGKKLHGRGKDQICSSPTMHQTVWGDRINMDFDINQT